MKTKISLAVLFLGASLFAAQPADEELFLKPHLADLAGKVVFEGGESLASEKKATYDHAISVNIGKNLPTSLQFVTKDDAKELGLAVHMKEIAMSLKANGTAVITAPASYGIVFTDSTCTVEKAFDEIYATLAKITTTSDAATIEKSLSGLNGVTRATFVERNGTLALVTDERILVNGEKIWRKTPEGVEINAYHSEEEFLVAISNAGLTCEEIKRPCFFGEVKWKAYNASLKEGEKGLGVAYMDNHPFTLYVVCKKA